MSFKKRTRKEKEKKSLLAIKKKERREIIKNGTTILVRGFNQPTKHNRSEHN